MRKREVSRRVGKVASSLGRGGDERTGNRISFNCVPEDAKEELEKISTTLEGATQIKRRGRGGFSCGTRKFAFVLGGISGDKRVGSSHAPKKRAGRQIRNNV